MASMLCIGRVQFERRFPRSLLFYFVCALVFTAGYFFGVHQQSQWCRDRYAKYSATWHAQYKNVVSGPTRAPPVNTLLVLIFSAPPNKDRRQVIRQTWLLTKGPEQSIRHLFVVGSAALPGQQLNALVQEHNAHSDLLILQSVQDSYANLSLKLIESFKYIYGRYNFSFVLKVDDDSFARLDEIYYRINMLESEATNRLYWGFFDGQARIKARGKWKESKWFLCDRYLPYAKGGGYVISKDLVYILGIVSPYLTMYQNEDVALGTWLAPYDLQRRHDPLFDTEHLSRGCHNDYLVTHKQSTAMMIEKHRSIQRSGDLCSSEHKERNSYIYNWGVPPSQCCLRNDSSVP